MKPLDEGRLTVRQAVLLMVILRLIHVIVFLPELTSPPANQDVWISEIISLPIVFLLALPVLALTSRYPEHSLVQQAEVVLGPAGKVIGFLYAWFFFHFTAITLSKVGLFMTAAVLPQTPLLAFTLPLVIVGASAARNGIGPIGTIAEVLVPPILLVVLLVPVLAIKDFDLRMFQPVLENGLGPVLHGGGTIAARMAEVAVLGMIAPLLRRKDKATRVAVGAFTLATFFVLLVTLPVLGVLGPEESRSRTFAYFTLIRMISIGEFVERIEMLHVLIWVLGAFVKLSVWYYLAALALAQATNLPSWRPLVLPLGLLAVVLSIYQFPNLPALIEFASYRIWAPYVLVFTTVIPALLLLVTLLRRTGRRKSG